MLELRASEVELRRSFREPLETAPSSTSAKLTATLSCFFLNSDVEVRAQPGARHLPLPPSPPALTLCSVASALWFVRQRLRCTVLYPSFTLIHFILMNKMNQRTISVRIKAYQMI